MPFFNRHKDKIIFHIIFRATMPIPRKNVAIDRRMTFICYFCEKLQFIITMKIIKPLIITITLLTTLLIIITLITPPIAKNYIKKHSKELIGRQINLQGLYLNIFTGYARLSGFELLEQNDKDKFITFDTLAVDVSLFRLLANEVKINQIHLVNPDISLLQNGSSFNFDDLLASSPIDSATTTSQTMAPASVATPPAATIPKDTATTEGMAIALYNIQITGGHIQYKDLLRNSLWDMENFGLQIPGVYFNGKNTDVGIALNFNDGGHLQTAIQYNMEAGNYLLDIDLSNFSIAPIRPYLVDFLNINTLNGILNTHLNIEGNANHITELSVRGEISLHQLSLTDLQNKPVLSTDSIRIEMENINPEKSIYHFNTVIIDGIKSGFKLEQNGNTFSQLLKPTGNATTQADIPESAPETSAPEISPDFKVNVFRINNSLFTFQDHTLPTPFNFHLENINVSADQLTLDQKNKAKISCSLNNGGTIVLNYEGKPDDFSNTDLLLSIKNMDLKTFTPYSLQYFGYPLKQGILSFNSVNHINNNLLDGRNGLNIAKCEVDNKQKNPKPEYNIPLKTALYLIKDKNDQIKMDLPVQGNINSPEFSYRKIIFKTLTNLLVKVAVSPVSFLANNLGLSPDKLQELPFGAAQYDFTPEQVTLINQLAAMIKAKPEMTLVMEQFINKQQSQTELATFYVKRNYYLHLHLEKTQESLQPIDYSKIMEIRDKDIHFLNYIAEQVSDAYKTAYLEEQILSLADTSQINSLTDHLIDKRNSTLKNYLLHQGIPEKCFRITTPDAALLANYKGKNRYTVNLIFEGDEPDQELLSRQENQVD